MVHVDAFMRAQFGHLAPGAPMLDKPECPWSPKLAEDAARIGSVTAAAARIRVPWLLVHGEADELVPCQDALDARQAAGGRPELVTFPGIDHRLQRRAPAGDRRRRALVARATVAQPFRAARTCRPKAGATCGRLRPALPQCRAALQRLRTCGCGRPATTCGCHGSTLASPAWSRVQSRVKRQARGDTSTPSRPVNRFS